MDSRRVEVEDLPPLELRELRKLDLEEPSRPGRPAHLSAASAVVQRGDFVYVIGDDELFLAVFEASKPEPGRLVRALAGRLPLDDDARKDAKPDLEVLSVLPPFEGHSHGALLGLGSGSSPNRDRGFVWELCPDGSLGEAADELDLEPLYSLLRRHMGDLNIEGAAVMGDQLWLLNRGNGDSGANVVAELALGEVMESLVGDRKLEAEEVRGLRSYDLGALGDVELTFSDASPLGEELLVFTASAEASGDSYSDGKILGSVVGTIDADGEVRRLRTIDRDYKVEGVHAALDAGVITLTLVCDQDDVSVASPLLSATLPLDAEPRA